jgi:hypothetical protein
MPTRREQLGQAHRRLEADGALRHVSLTPINTKEREQLRAEEGRFKYARLEQERELGELV